VKVSIVSGISVLKNHIIIIGGGAAGIFAAIAAAEAGAQVTLLEQSPQLLGKVKVSGGGRCNVTHQCPDPKVLVTHYPRGSKELLGPFNRFGPRNTIEWFESRGVKLKTEADGRMFPVTDRSQTIMDCLLHACDSAGVKRMLRCGVESLEAPTKENKKWIVHTAEQKFEADAVLLAPGSSNKMWQMVAELGHKMVEPVPSLFTFHVKDNRIEGLAGLSVPDAIASAGKISQRGPALITHWGFSGPAILKLSAWGARYFHEKNYSFTLTLNWTGEEKSKVEKWIADQRKNSASKKVSNTQWPVIPQRLWSKICEAATISEDSRWADLQGQQMKNLLEQLCEAQFPVTGKSTFKEEFVTAGGVKLSEVDFRTMESKIVKGLFFAGEFLDIDAVTGGFNFQAAWTTGWIAGNAMAEKK
jgi:predicted Rossmann fold flavoprotein